MLKFLITISLLLVALPAPPAASSAAPSPIRAKTTSTEVHPMRFEPNVGQTHPDVRYVAKGRGYSVFVTADGPTLALQTPNASEGEAIRMRFVGMSPEAPVVAEREAQGTVNYLKGNDPEKWHRDIPTFEAVRTRDAYAGIDAVLYGADGRLEYDFVVAPGADPRQIRVSFEGQQSLEVSPEGDLLLGMQNGEIRQQRARVYQDGPAGKTPVAARYVLGSDGEVGFDVANYDPAKPLVIDPVLVYSVYLGGGSGVDIARAVTVLGIDSVYLVGETHSREYPGSTLGGGGFGGRADVFLSKYGQSLGEPVFTVTFGGLEDDTPTDVAVDETGRIYVSGVTKSDAFPTTVGAYDRGLSGPTDGFVVRINQAGTNLELGTYLGGNQFETLGGLAVDAAGAVYVAGSTQSDDFPISPGAFDASRDGLRDAFVTKLDPTFGSIAYSTLLGGSGVESAVAVAVDPTGNAFVTGETSGAGFPTTAGAFDTSHNGGADAFVAKVNPTGSSLLYSTFLGGSSDESGLGIAIDPTGTAYVTGRTASAVFPTTAGAFDTTLGGTRDAFVTKLAPTGASLVVSTYLGGAADDVANAIAIDSAGRPLVAGATASTDFPVSASAYDASFSGGESDAFVTRLEAAGTSLASSTYLGGDDEDIAYGVAVGADDSMILAGTSDSSDYPTAGGIGVSYGWDFDVIVSRLSANGQTLQASDHIAAREEDHGRRIATDDAGNVFVVGYTYSVGYPTTNGSEMLGDGDIVITKIAPDGASLVYSTYFGGRAVDVANDIVVDGSGMLYLVGYTQSDDYPTTNGAYSMTLAGADDVIVTKLDASSNALVYSTYVGGAASDVATSCALVGTTLVVGGETRSATFPTTPGAYDATLAGGRDGFVLRLASGGDALLSSTFVGGASTSLVTDVAALPDGSSYVVGDAGIGFEATPGVFDTTSNGAFDVFVAKFTPSGGDRVFATFLGGSHDDVAAEVGLDASGGIYVLSSTNSSNYPTTAGAFDTVFDGPVFFSYGDAALTRLTADASAAVYSTFVGGASIEAAYGLAVAPDGTAYVVGETLSTDFPTTPGALSTMPGPGFGAGFLGVFDAQGSSLEYGTYFAGLDGEVIPRDVAVDGSGIVSVIGTASSSQFPHTTYGTQDFSNVFVVRLDPSLAHGTDTPGVYVPSSGAWFLRNASSAGPADLVFGYGPSGLGWSALRGDWNGDGVDSPGLYDPATGNFFLRNASGSGAADIVFGFGPAGAGWTPLVGDWNSDGVDTVGLYSPSNGFFFLRDANAPGPADLVFGFGPGGLGWMPVTGDFDGNGEDTVGLYSPSNGFFFLRNVNKPGSADLVFGYGPGGAGWTPLVGDWNGDRSDTVGLYSQSNGFYFLRNANSSGPADVVFGYGPAGATPLVGDWDGL